ncbi:hypothetical protein NP7_05780 [Moraxella osloensis]|uniref:Glycosyl transferase family 1 domain-containing protein n=2 Tax=Faucicola osloensis TaxID=34062 RepID=A0A2D2LUV1_FAUOS|nr:hypothetical protein NP7_05780 [Moraxella osloensis]
MVFYFDVLKYPPILSLIEILLDKSYKVTLLGYCSCIDNINYLIQKGLVFIEMVETNNKDKNIVKLFKHEKFRRLVNKVISDSSMQDKIWYLGSETIFLFIDEIGKNNSILYFFEVPYFNVPSRYRFWTTDEKYKFAISKANKVVNCEFNRTLITKSYFGLSSNQAVTIPNKTNFKMSLELNSENIDLLKGVENKKIILYQGVFNFPERKLDELCQSINLLSEEFVIVLMGADSDYKQLLKQKYESNRVLFLPFLPPPLHLKITKLARIGFLSYFPNKGEIEQVLNVLYCAPNKIFEYARFGIPMISNRTPSLETIYQNYKCGIGIDLDDLDDLAGKIMEIDKNYDFYSKNSKSFFDSVNIEDIIIDEILS